MNLRSRPTLDADMTGDEPPTLFCLHFLGGSAREWGGVIERCAPTVRGMALDLPGFGKAAGERGFAIDAMADHVVQAVRTAAPARWMLAGHSMGAKVALVVARRAMGGAEGLGGLERLVLIAGSPPGPEPMDEGKRRTMLGWFAGGSAATRREAESYIDGNVGAPLDPALREQAVEDVIRMDRGAWIAWLDRGSRDDWSQRIGTLDVPALLIAGDRDESLGPAAQTSLMAPHLPRGRLVTLAGAGHLLPLERPDELARLILGELGATASTPRPEPGIPSAYRALIDSDRVSTRTRSVLLERSRAVEPTAPPALRLEDVAALRAVLDRVVPQADAARIDLAARIDRTLASGPGDGWRFAALPPDVVAFRLALATLNAEAQAAHGRDFAALSPEAMDDLLTRAADGRLGAREGAAGPGRLDASRMKLWFEDLRGLAVQTYVSHPATLARLGYSGIANGGDGARKQGFVTVGVGEREAWEPQAEPAP